MSQKSSDPQAISFVSQPLKRDTSHASAGQINNALRDNFSFPIVAQT